MSNILIAAYGSRGDIMPLTDIAHTLHAAGHHVTMTTNTDLVDDVTALGIDARPVDFTLDAGADPAHDDPMKLAMQMVKPAGMRQLGHNLLAVVADVPADLVFLTPFAELAGHAFAEQREIPSAGLRLQPISATRDFPPALLGAWSVGALNRSVGRSATRWFDRIYGRVSADLRRELDLPHRSARSARRHRTAEHWPILHGFSPSVVPRPADWRDGIDVVGYWWPRTPDSWTPPQHLVDFLASGPPPVFVGFGSLILGDDAAGQLGETIAAAVATAGVRAVVQSGGTALTLDNPRVCNIGAVPHDWLLPHCAAAVHSCGAGTAAAALNAGIPTVAVPSPGGDQPFWAHRLTTLGASTTPITRTKLTADALAASLTTAITDPRLTAAARHLQAAITADHGADRVADLAHNLLT